MRFLSEVFAGVKYAAGHKLKHKAAMARSSNYRQNLPLVLTYCQPEMVVKINGKCAPCLDKLN